MVRFNESLGGIYYLGVYGWTSGLYMITPMVARNRSEFRNSGAFEFQYTLLPKGLPALGHHSLEFFKIDNFEKLG